MGARIIAIAGGSGSGKTTLAQKLLEALGPSRAAVLAQDHYYIDQSARFDGDGGAVNFDHPSAIEFTLMAKHLAELKEGRPVEVPRYDFATHTRKRETVRLEPHAIIIAEGILLLSQEVIRAEVDASVFVRTSEEARFSRRLERDVRERGREPEGVKRQFDRQVKPMHERFVEASAGFATKVVSGEGAIETELEVALSLALSLP